MTYFYKKTSDTYHWHSTCSKLPANVRTNSDWVVTTTKPTGREQCNECKGKDK